MRRMLFLNIYSSAQRSSRTLVPLPPLVGTRYLKYSSPTKILELAIWHVAGLRMCNDGKKEDAVERHTADTLPFMKLTEKIVDWE